MSIIKTADAQLILNDIPVEKALPTAEIHDHFTKLAQQLIRLSKRSDEFLYFSTVMMCASEAALIDQKTGEPLKDKDGKVITGSFNNDWKWICSDPSIDPYQNGNGDIFPEVELKKAHKSAASAAYVGCTSLYSAAATADRFFHPPPFLA